MKVKKDGEIQLKIDLINVECVIYCFKRNNNQFQRKLFVHICLLLHLMAFPVKLYYTCWDLTYRPMADDEF